MKGKIAKKVGTIGYGNVLLWHNTSNFGKLYSATPLIYSEICYLSIYYQNTRDSGVLMLPPPQRKIQKIITVAIITITR